MSDTFDHMCDAYDQYVLSGEDPEYGPACIRHDTSSYVLRAVDPLYYHTKHKYIEIVHETKLATLFKFTEHHLVWVPKALCRKHKRKKKKIWIWSGFDFESAL